MTSWNAPTAEVPKRAFARVNAPSFPSAVRLVDAFAGPGRPAGIVSVRREDFTVVIEFDRAITSWSLVRALAAAETLANPEFDRSRPWPSDDTTLTALCSHVLSDRELDGSRLIETYLLPMLNESL